MTARRRCAFCRDKARATYDDVPMCWLHTVRLYIALHSDWHD